MNGAGPDDGGHHSGSTSTWIRPTLLGLLVAVTLWPAYGGWRLIAAYAAIPLHEVDLVRELSADGRLGPGIQGGVGVALDEDGAVFVADPNTQRVFAFDDGTSESARIVLSGAPATPWDVAIGPRGNLLVVDRVTGTLVVATREGQTETSFRVAMGQPVAIAVDRHGSIFVADPGAERIRKFLADGEVDRAWGDSADPGTVRLPTVHGLACVGDELIAASGLDGGTLVRYDAGGSVLGRKPVIGNVGHLTATPTGALFMSDISADRVWILDREGATIGRVVGPNGDEALFRQPRDLAATDDGHLFVLNITRLSVYRFREGPPRPS